MVRSAVFLSIVILPMVAYGGPMPPCGAEPSPAYGTIGGGPHLGTWTEAELKQTTWQPPPCLAWSGETKFVAAVASRFVADVNVFDRLGMISAWPGVKYWSVSRQRWQPLVLDAWAVDAAGHRQGDIPGSSLEPGRNLLFVERDANSGETTYRMRVLERTSQRLVVATENVRPIKMLLLTAFEPGALQTVTFVQKESGSVWSTYQITRVGSGGSSLALDHKGSFVNRLEAVRRYLAGEASDQRPPLAPR
jgi:hypothetical protein